MILEIWKLKEREAALRLLEVAKAQERMRMETTGLKVVRIDETTVILVAANRDSNEAKESFLKSLKLSRTHIENIKFSGE